MRLSPQKTLLVGILLTAMFFELVWAFWPRLNLLADPYRFAERQKAMSEWGRQRTPESKAVSDYERKLLADHSQRITFLMIAAVIIEGAVVTVIVRRPILNRSHENAA